MRTEEQNKRMRDDRRDRILSCAVKLFAKRGIGATKISDIAAAVKMSQGLLYHYFGSKEEIFTEIIRTAFEKMNRAARGLETLSQSPLEKLTAAAVQILRSICESEDFVWFSTLISTASVSDAIPREARQIIKQEREIPYQVIARIARAGQKDGSVRAGNPADLSLVFWTAIKGLALHKAALGDAFRTPKPSVLTSIFFEEKFQ